MTEQHEQEAFKRWSGSEPIELTPLTIDDNITAWAWASWKARAALENQPQAGQEPVEGGWHWVRFESLNGLTDWTPAQRQRNHWNSVSFSGIPSSEVTVGPALTHPTPQAAHSKADQTEKEAPVAEVYWDAKGEWQLKMLVELSVAQNDRIKLYEHGFVGVPVLIPETMQILDASKPLAESVVPTKWPQTPAEIREFVGWNANSKRYANAPTSGDDYQAFLDSEPSENDTYSVSAHDLLSSFAEWEDVHGASEDPQLAAAQGDETTKGICEEHTHTQEGKS